MFRALFQAQVRLRNGVIRLIGRMVAGVDRQIHTWTAKYDHSELDLVAPRPADQKGLDPAGWLRRLSFPHMAATTVVWIDVLLASTLLPYNETVAHFFYLLAYLLYPAAFFASARLRPWLSGHSLGPWIVNGSKSTGLFFATISLLVAFIQMAILFIFLAVIWIVVAILAIVFLPGIGWLAVSSEIKGIIDLIRPKKPGSPKPEPL